MFSSINFELQCKISGVLALCLLHSSVVDKINLWTSCTCTHYFCNLFIKTTSQLILMMQCNHEREEAIMRGREHPLIWHASMNAIINDQHICAWDYVFSKEIVDVIALSGFISKQSNIRIQLFCKKTFSLKNQSFVKNHSSSSFQLTEKFLP